MNKKQQRILNKAIRRFEAAVRDHEMLGASHPESHGYIRYEYGRAKSNLHKVIDDIIFVICFHH